MADRFGQLDNSYSGGSDIWDGLVGSILLQDYFDVPAPTGAIYIGAAGVAVKYVGVRTEEQLYLGAGNLWP